MLCETLCKFIITGVGRNANTHSLYIIDIDIDMLYIEQNLIWTGSGRENAQEHVRTEFGCNGWPKKLVQLISLPLFACSQPNFVCGTNRHFGFV